MKHQNDWYFDHKKPFDARITIYMIAEDVSIFLDGDYNVQWSTSRSKLSSIYNEVVQLHLHPLDYLKLIRAADTTSTDQQLQIPFSYE